MVFDGEGCRGCEFAVEEGHLGFVSYKHVGELAIGEGLEEDVASVVGKALGTEGSRRQGDAPEGLDWIDIYL